MYICYTSIDLIKLLLFDKKKKRKTKEWNEQNKWNRSKSQFMSLTVNLLFGKSPKSIVLQSNLKWKAMENTTKSFVYCESFIPFSDRNESISMPVRRITNVKCLLWVAFKKTFNQVKMNERIFIVCGENHCQQKEMPKKIDLSFLFIFA